MLFKSEYPVAEGTLSIHTNFHKDLLEIYNNVAALID